MFLWMDISHGIERIPGLGGICHRRGLVDICPISPVFGRVSIELICFLEGIFRLTVTLPYSVPCTGEA